MMKSNHRILFVLTLAIFQLSSFTVQCDNYFSAPWLNYNKHGNKFTLANLQVQAEVQFEFLQQQIVLDQISISKNGYWKSQYQIASKQIKLSSFTKGQNLLVKISKNQGNKIESIQFYVKTKIVQKRNNVYVSISNQEGQSFKKISQVCQESNQNQNLMKCKFQKIHSVSIFAHTGNNNSQIFEMLKSQKQSGDFEFFISSFTQALNLRKDVNNSKKFAKQMITETLSSLCIQQSQYEGFQFYGLCSNLNSKQIQRHYSLLIIDILFKYNADLAVWLVENFLDLLEQKMFYSFTKSQFIPVPEHVEVFLTYLSHISQIQSLKSQELRIKINKVINIQNGLINNLLLSQVNHLSQQMNYRENNKVHPTLLKMLKQAWKTDLSRARVSSIYSESFTNDFFYHEQNQKLDSSVGKIMWLIKLINQHTKVIRKYGDSYQKESLQQLSSLSKVIQGYVLDEPRAKEGAFHSIIVTQKLRVYSPSIGYQSLLPFSYEISPQFPVKTFFNLTTEVGLSSMPPDHQQASQNYNFRGNVNLYFNYKILFKMIQRCIDNPKLKIYYNGLKAITEQIQKHIFKEYDTNNNYFTSWTSSGKGKDSEKSLALLNVAFLKEIKVEGQKPSKQKKQQ